MALGHLSTPEKTRENLRTSENFREHPAPVTRYWLLEVRGYIGGREERVGLRVMVALWSRYGCVLIVSWSRYSRFMVTVR